MFGIFNTMIIIFTGVITVFTFIALMASADSNNSAELSSKPSLNFLLGLATYCVITWLYISI